MQSPVNHLAVPAPASGTSTSLDTHVRAIMRAGVISVPDDASVRQVQRALVAHGVHAVLVVSVQTGEPIGWATTRGVLEHALAYAALLPAALVVTEPVEAIAPSATGEEALRRMVETGAARLLVRRHPGSLPEGVVSDMDLIPLDDPDLSERITDGRPHASHA